MSKSRYPLFGLPHKVSIIRKVEGDDGFGGSNPNGAEVVIYSNHRCRITIHEDEEEGKGYGHDGEKAYDVTLVWSPNLQTDDFIRVPWGTIPNTIAPTGLGNAWPWTIVVSTPAGDKSLVWNDTTSQFQDSAVEYTLAWNGSAWVFTDTIAPDSITFTGYTEDQRIFKLDWSAYDSAYAVVSSTGPTIDMRIINEKGKIDDLGGEHHHHVVAEIEGTDS